MSESWKDISYDIKKKLRRKLVFPTIQKKCKAIILKEELILATILNKKTKFNSTMFRVKKNKKQKETENHPILEKFKTWKFMSASA